MQRLRTTFTRSRTPTGAEMKTQNSLEVPKQVRSASFDEMQLEVRRVTTTTATTTTTTTIGVTTHLLKQQSSSSTDERSTTADIALLQVPQITTSQRSHSLDSSAGSDDSGTFLEVPRNTKTLRRPSNTKTPPPCIHCLYLEEYERRIAAEKRTFLDHREITSLSYDSSEYDESDGSSCIENLSQNDDDDDDEDDDHDSGGDSNSQIRRHQKRRTTIGSSATTSEDEGLDDEENYGSHYDNKFLRPPPLQQQQQQQQQVTTSCNIKFTLSPEDGDGPPFPFPIELDSPPISPILSTCSSPLLELPPPPPTHPSTSVSLSSSIVTNSELIIQLPVLPPPPAFASIPDTSFEDDNVSGSSAVSSSSPTTLRTRRRSISRQEAIFVEPTGNSLENVSTEEELRLEISDKIDGTTTTNGESTTIKSSLVVRDIYLTVPDLKRDRAASVDSCFSKVPSSGKTEELQPSDDGCFLAVPNINATRSRSVDIVLPTDEQARYKALALTGSSGIYADGLKC